MEKDDLEKAQREALLAALRETAGSISAEGHPEWETSEKVAAWVREGRKQSDERVDRYRRG